jgi:CheY-like chemotaxis protein
MTIDAVDAVPTRVLIVDDAASTRRFLRGVLDYCPEFEVAGEAVNGAEAVEMADSLQPDVVLLDLCMPVVDGSGALGSLLRVAPNSKVIVLSGMSASREEPLLAQGATGFVPKGLAPFDLLERLGAIVGRPVTLQRSAPEQQRIDDPEKPKIVEPLQARGVICDDDPMVRRLLGQVLANCDVPVLAETDGVPALLSVIELAQPEVLVLDLWLEGMTGTSAIPEIRKLSPRTVVLVYSAYEEWKDNALAAGASAFVAKPNFEQLEAEILRLTRAIR